MCLAALFAEWTGLEPATPCVTGMYSNQLNYHSVWDCKYTLRFFLRKIFFQKKFKSQIITWLCFCSYKVHIYFLRLYIGSVKRGVL